MRIVKDPEERKQEILTGAIKIFARKGYDRTTTSDIARELNISQGLCYRYFPTKEAIYDAALEKYAEEIAQGNLRNHSFDMPIRELIDHVTCDAERFKDAERDDEELYDFFHSENSKRIHDELFLKVAKKILPYVQEHLKKAKEHGEISIADTDTAAIIGVYGWIGLFMTNGLTDQERCQRMRNTWYQLLGL